MRTHWRVRRDIFPADGVSNGTCLLTGRKMDYFFRTQRVLVIDDDREVGSILRYALGSFGFEVVTCENAAEALLFLMRERFDYIITDYQMPGMDGLELTRRLRRLVEPLTVIIGMSGLDLDGEFLRAGANDFFRKPFPPYDLAMAIDGGNILA